MAYQAFDGSSTTWWVTSSGTQWIGWYFGALGAQVVYEFAVTVPSTGFAYDFGPGTFNLDYSDDGSSWTTGASFSGITWSSGQTQTFATGAASAHLYWRINTSATQEGVGSAIYIANIALHATSGGANLVQGTATATSVLTNSNTDSASSAAEFAPVVGSWQANTGVSAASWYYNFGAGLTPNIVEVAMTGAGGANANDSQSPTAFSVIYSDDGVTWYTAYSFSGVTWSSKYQVRVFDIPQPPNTPVDLSVGSATNASLTASWVDGGGGTTVSYTLQYRVTGTGPWTQITGIVGLSQYVFPLLSGTEYDFQVQAVNAAGSSAFTATVNGTTLAFTPVYPTNLATACVVPVG
jgi:hypothetical protein